MEGPGVIDTKIRHPKSVKRIRESRVAHHLEDVICHLSGRDTSLSRVDTLCGVPMQAKADRLQSPFRQGQQA